MKLLFVLAAQYFLFSLVSLAQGEPWTNNENFIWPAGNPEPSSDGRPGPPFFFRNDGSLFFGRNITQDVVPTNSDFTLWGTFMVSSNEPASGRISLQSIDNENWDWSSGISAFWQASDQPQLASSVFSVTAATTNSFRGVRLLSQVGGGVAIDYQTENGTLFQVSESGDIAGRTITIYGTTNQIVFGSTNTPPIGSTPSRWISVQVIGESTVYRLPLYQ